MELAIHIQRNFAEVKHPNETVAESPALYLERLKHHTPSSHRYASPKGYASPSHYRAHSSYPAERIVSFS